MISKLFNILLIREGERRQVIYFFILYAILGCGLAFGRNSADVLFFKRYGIEFLPVIYMVLSLFLALISAFYAAFADRIAPERLSVILFSFLICLLLGNWAWISFSDIDAAYPAYFLLYEIASEILVIHSIHYLAQNFDSLQAKRLFPLIMAGTQIGIILGSLILASLAQYIIIQDIMLGWCIILVIPVYMMYSWHKKRGSSTYFRPMHKSTERLKQAISQISYGFKLIKTSQLLKAASFALFFMVIAFYILSYSINSIYTKTFESEAELARFFGILTATTSGLALLLQVLITNRVIRRFGVKNVNLIFPVTSLFSYLALLSSFTLIPAIIGSVNKDAIMTAFRNPIRTMFFNTLPANVRGRANATSIVIVLPLALFVSGALLIIMQKSAEQNYFLSLGFIAAVFYLIYNLKMNKAYVSEMISTLKQKMLVASHVDSNEYTVNTSYIKSNIVLKLFEMLMMSYPDKAKDLIFSKIERKEERIAEDIINILVTIEPKGLIAELNALLKETKDVELLFATRVALFKLKDKNAIKLIASMLNDDNVMFQLSAIIGSLYQSDKEIINKAISQWEALLHSANSENTVLLPGMVEYLNMIPDESKRLLIIRYKNIIESILRAGNQTEITAVLKALLQWPELEYPEIAGLVTKLYQHSNTSVRLLCIQCSHLFYDTDQKLLTAAVEDNNRQIRQAAVRVHFHKEGDSLIDVLILWLSTDMNGSPRAQSAYIGLLHEIYDDIESYKIIARKKSEIAQDLFSAYQVLNYVEGKKSSALQLTRHVLQERIKQYINLSVYAMKGFENSSATYMIWAGLNSQDPQHIASACEVLRNLKSRDIGKNLADLIEQQSRNTNSMLNNKFGGAIESVLVWCNKQPDPWLSRCANEALKSLV